MPTNETPQKRVYRKRPRCPHCGAELSTAELGAMLSAMRTTRAGGRPRDLTKPRCPCGEMTANRAGRVGHHCQPTAPKKGAKT